MKYLIILFLAQLSFAGEFSQKISKNYTDSTYTEMSIPTRDGYIDIVWTSERKDRNTVSLQGAVRKGNALTVQDMLESQARAFIMNGYLVGDFRIDGKLYEIVPTSDSTYKIEERQDETKGLANDVYIHPKKKEKND